MASKPINIHWIRSGSKPYLKIMYCIVLHSIFHESSTNPEKIAYRRTYRRKPFYYFQYLVVIMERLCCGLLSSTVTSMSKKLVFPHYLDNISSWSAATL